MLTELWNSKEWILLSSIESTAHFLSNIIELIVNFEKGYEHELLAMIESLSKDLEHCKDALCVMDFEKNKGRLFELAIQKAGKILSSVPEVEKFAWEHSILQPPPYF
uniref:Uncharacterized protein n=1 Tax=Caenorhabditis japonica TaxID=281687 RepID=A0A8R1DUW3_CAEJA